MVGTKELLIILLVVLVVFGAKKLRTVGSDLGAAVRGFKKAMSDGEEEQSAQQKQIGSQKPDAEFDQAPKSDAQTSQTKSDRSV